MSAQPDYLDGWVARTEPAETAIADIIADVRATVRAQLNDARFGTLARRQLEIISLLAEGLSLGEVGDRLLLSRATVRNHLYNAKQRLGYYGTTTGFVVECCRRGLVIVPGTAPGLKADYE